MNSSIEQIFSGPQGGIDIEALRQLATSPTLTKSNKDAKLIVFVEGQIGAGKSTALANIEACFRNTPGVRVLYEPVDEWKRVDTGNGGNMLSSMYDGTLSTAVFQLAVLQSRFALLIKALGEPDVRVVISERGPWSEKLVFARSNLGAADWAVYEYAHSSMLRDLFPLAGTVSVAFLHFKLSVDEAMERLHIRGRTEEQSIDRDYLQLLSDASERMELLLSKNGLGVSNVVGTTKHIYINAEQTPEQVAKAAMASIDNFIRRNIKDNLESMNEAERLREAIAERAAQARQTMDRVSRETTPRSSPHQTTPQAPPPTPIPEAGLRV